MSIVFAAIVPHPPVLIPSIGKENLNRLKKTSQAYEKLALELKEIEPETIFIISPHGQIQLASFTMNFNPEYKGVFEEFGDFSTKITFEPNTRLIYRIRESLETTAPLQLISQPELDYGATVPLHLLTKDLPKIEIIPLYHSQLSLEEHYQFGTLLKEQLLKTNNRVAVIASGDLSHRLTKDSPGGYSIKGKKFDKKIVTLLSGNQVENILKIDESLIAEAGECGLRSIVILLGILNKIKYQPALLSYEAPFGVGYLVMQFKL